MADLMQRVWDRALRAGLPLSIHFDVTYRCNERCVHCYLDHDDHGEMSTAEIVGIFEQLAAAGTLFLTLSGGEIMLRDDLFELVAAARARHFDVKLKTNGILLGAGEVARLKALGVRQVQISLYSHQPETHDAITKVRGSWSRTVAAVERLAGAGMRVTIANVLMRQNAADYPGVRALADALGVDCTIDPTITPKMDGDASVVTLRVPAPQLLRVFRDRSLVGDDFLTDGCGAPPGEETLDERPCSAGHTFCYISPYGDVYPCVQFPLPSGNLRRQRFDEIWTNSPQLAEVRSIRVRDLPTCSSCSHAATCTRCPGLAYMEGDMRGPSSADCEKSQIRAGVLPPPRVA